MIRNFVPLTANLTHPTCRVRSTLAMLRKMMPRLMLRKMMLRIMLRKMMPRIMLRKMLRMAMIRMTRNVLRMPRNISHLTCLPRKSVLGS